MSARQAERMRVALVVEQLRRSVTGGIGTYATGLLQGLDTLARSSVAGPLAEGTGPNHTGPNRTGPNRTGPEVTLLTSRPPRGPDPLVALGHPVLASRLPGFLLTRAWDAGLAAPRGFDLVHAVSLAVPRGGAQPVVATVHDLAWRTIPSAFPVRGRRWHEQALARALARATLFVVPSEVTAADLVGAGADAARVRVVEEGADHLPAPDAAGTGALLDRLGVQEPYLLSVGTIEPRKNLEAVLAAYRHARAHLPGRWPLLVVGPQGWGPDPTVVSTGLDGVAHNQAADNPGVLRTGKVEPGVLAGLYAGSRCLVYVPLTEGWGLPPVEAMAAGTPVVASPMPSTGKAALEVDPCDVAAIADALVVASTDQKVRAELVSAGRARAAGLTWEAAARRHVELWEGVA